MKIRVVAVGKIRENYIQQGINQFSSRLEAHTKLKTTEVKPEAVSSELSSAERKQIKEAEAEKLISRLEQRAYSIALDPEGKPMTSEGLAKSIGNLQVQGYSQIDFIIGGALGLGEKIKNEVDHLLTFSQLTFTHQMIRLFLLEQVYRAFKILNNEPYHL